MMRRNLPGLVFVFACGVGSFLAARAARAADLPQLPSVDGGIQWGPVLVALLVGGLVVAGIAWIRHNPGKVAQAKETAAQAASEAELLKSGFSGVVADCTKLADRLTRAAEALTAHTLMQATPVAPAPSEAAPAVPPAGKSGQAGTFSLEVTGDPATDLPAITAAYLAK